MKHAFSAPYTFL